MNKPELLEILRCPSHPDGRPLSHHTESLWCPECGMEFPIVDGIPILLASSHSNGGYRSAEQQQWDAQASTYETRRAEDATYLAGVRSVVANLAASSGDLVLDAGCGTGFTVRRYQFSGIRTVALDLSLQSLLYLKHRLPPSNAVDLVCGDLTALPFVRGAFDKVVCANTLQHVPDAEQRQRAVRELARVGRSGAKVVVSVHNYSNLKRRAGWTKEGRAGGHSGAVQYIYRFTTVEFEALLAEGLRVRKVKGAGLPLFYRCKLGLLMDCVERIAGNFRISTHWSNMLVGIANVY